MIKYVVINPDGTYAGVPCTSRGEAIDLASQRKGRVIGEIIILPFVEHIHCPVNDCKCPYYDNGICTLEDPASECDDFASMYDEDDEYICEGDKDCAVWRKE